jgi:transcriptional regulator with XRE-family HTH domain
MKKIGKEHGKAGALFRATRDLLHCTQRELGQHLLLSQNYIAQIECGAKQPSPRALRDLEALRARLLPKGVSRASGSEGGTSPAPTRAGCHAALDRVLDEYEPQSGGLGYVAVMLQKTFPPERL